MSYCVANWNWALPDSTIILLVNSAAYPGHVVF